MTLWFDFDGTLTDVRQKYVSLYRSFMETQSGQALSDSAFWELKRTGGGNQEICKASGMLEPQFGEFSHFIEKNVELEFPLGLDRLFPQARKTLHLLGEQHHLNLISHRRNRANLTQQLDRFGLKATFNVVLTTGDQGNHKRAKADAILAAGLTPPAMIIGDSELDMATGRHLKIHRCAMTSGVRCRAFLERFDPEHIADSLSELPAFVELVERETTQRMANTNPQT